MLPENPAKIHVISLASGAASMAWPVLRNIVMPESLSGTVRTWFTTGAIALAVVAGLSPVASAQTIDEIKLTAFERLAPMRDIGNKPLWISFSDCTYESTGDVITISIRASGFSNGQTLEVWAGEQAVDCTERASRTGTSPSCWQVYSQAISSNFVAVDMRTQDIVARHKTTRSDADGGWGPGTGTLEECTSEGIDATALNLTFMFLTGGGEVAGTGQVWTQTGIDVIGPSAPTDIAAATGDTTLAVSWTGSSSLGRYGYNIYCAANSGGGDAAADAGGSCGSSALTAGSLPDPDLLCGSAAGAATSKGTAFNLTNGQSYAVAVSSYDDILNQGPLSENACGTPTDLIDFWQDYVSSGGRDPGGLCNYSPASPTRHWPIGFGLLGFIALAILRKVRS